MGFRNFTVRFFILLAVFLAINALIWFGWTKEITDPRRDAGDLLRVGYILGHVSQRHHVDDLPSKHLEMKDYHGGHVDMVTIGDSFSNGGGKGRNSHYQDYIASLHGLTVLNVPSNVIEIDAQMITLSKMINSGYLDVIKPKYLLLESSERFAIQRCTIHLSLKPTASIDEINKSFLDKHSDEKKTKVNNFDFKFANNGNWKFVANNIQYLFRDKPYHCPILISKLNRRFFSTDHGDELIFYQEDAKNCKLSTPGSVVEANRNLNNLAAVLKAKGITLIFMPVVNKLNLYEPYLRNHRYPQSVFFEELRKLHKDYIFIDTKSILSRALEEGELDIFHADDTHWSWKASQRIFSTVDFSTQSDLVHGVGKQ